MSIWLRFRVGHMASAISGTPYLSNDKFVHAWREVGVGGVSTIRVITRFEQEKAHELRKK